MMNFIVWLIRFNINVLNSIEKMCHYYVIDKTFASVVIDEDRLTFYLILSLISS